jgi:hypothetical protein
MYKMPRFVVQLTKSEMDTLAQAVKFKLKVPPQNWSTAEYAATKVTAERTLAKLRSEKLDTIPAFELSVLIGELARHFQIDGDPDTMSLFLKFRKLFYSDPVVAAWNREVVEMEELQAQQKDLQARLGRVSKQIAKRPAFAKAK